MTTTMYSFRKMNHFQAFTILCACVFISDNSLQSRAATTNDGSSQIPQEFPQANSFQGKNIRIGNYSEHVQCESKHRNPNEGKKNSTADSVANNAVKTDGVQCTNNKVDSVQDTNNTSCLWCIARAISATVVNHNMDKASARKMFTSIRPAYQKVLNNLTQSIISVIKNLEEAKDLTNAAKWLSIGNDEEEAKISAETPVKNLNNINTNTNTNTKAIITDTIENNNINNNNNNNNNATTTTKRSTSVVEDRTWTSKMSSWSSRDGEKEKSENSTSTSFVTPALLVVIFTLISYIAYLHQKLRTISNTRGRFKNTNIAYRRHV